MKKSLSVIIAVVGLVILSSLKTSAQVDAQFTQYYEVPTFYNAAATGQTDFIRLRGGTRMQWVGIENAPKTFLLTGDMPFKFINRRFGTGLIVNQESMGLYKNLNLGAQIAYKLKFMKGELSIGLQVGFMNQTFKGSDVVLPDDDDYHEGSDDGIPTTDLNGTSIDLGVGAFFKHRLFWAGVSLQHANSPTITFNAESGEGANEKNYEFKAGRILYLMAGGNIPIKNTLFEVLPSVMVKTDFTFTTAEATARLRFRKFLSAGVGYRHNDAVSLVLGVDFKNFYLGYSYDYPVNAISKASSGSHEIFAGYSLKLDLSEKNKNKHKSIRIM